MPPLDYGDLAKPKFPIGAQTIQVTRVIEIGPWTRAAQDRLRILVNLPVGWDDDDSAPVSVAAKLQALELIDLTTKLGMPSPHIVPISGGGIQFEWRRSGGDMEIEILHDGTVGYLLSDSNGKMLSGDIALSNNSVELFSIIDWFRKENKNLDCFAA